MKKQRILFILLFAFGLLSCGDSSKEKEVNTENSEKSAELLWLEKITETEWSEIERPDHSIKFGKPAKEDKVFTGEYVETFPGGSTICQYRTSTIGEFNMKLIKNIVDGKEAEANGADFVFKIELLDQDTTLVLNLANGRTIRYTRPSGNNASVKETKAEANNQNTPKNLWLEKVEGEWKNNETGHPLRFTKPIQQGEIISGELELDESSFIQVYKYTRTEDGLMKCKLVRFKMQGDTNYTDDDSGKDFDFTFNSELMDNGNSLTLKHSNGKVFTYKR